MHDDIHIRSIAAQLLGHVDRPLTGSELINAILEDPGAPEKLAQVSSVWLHRLVCEVGMADASELLEMVTPEQVREVLDLELWQGDRLDHYEALDWLHFLSTLSSPAAERHLRGLDVELLGLVLFHHLRIYLVEEETVPDEPEGSLYPTPDGWFVLEIMVENEADVAKVISLVDTLYQDDQDNIRRLLQNLMWELTTELEEWSLRWRNARLQDLGFADPIEALELYAYLDPKTVEVKEQSADQPLRGDPEPVGATPLEALTESGESSFLDRALARAAEDPAEEARLAMAMVTLCNRSLAADRVESSDRVGARTSLEQLHWRISLGLEHLCEGDEERGPEVLASVALVRIARVGHSLTLELRRHLLPLLREGRLGRTPGQVDLLDPPLAQHIAALLLPRPRLWSVLNGAGNPFCTVADLDTAWENVRQLEQTLALAGRISLSVPMPDAVTYGDLVRTLVINSLLKRQGPVDADALAQFLQEHVQAERLGGEVLEAALSLLQPEEQGRPIVEGWIRGLEDSVARLMPRDLDMRFVDGLWKAR